MTLREKLAELCHEQWSGWMKWMLPKVEQNEWTERWTRQMNTPYAELLESEKESDRKEADRILAIISTSQPVEAKCKHAHKIYWLDDNGHRVAMRSDLDSCPTCPAPTQAKSVEERS